jgi:hypothetical protein
MADEKLNALNDADLEQATGGYSYTDTTYTHKGCGGKIQQRDEFEPDAPWYRRMFMRHNLQYICTTCGKVWSMTSDTVTNNFDTVG